MNPADTRSRILDAACDLFSERGYHATTLGDVAKRAGLTTGSVYSNFDGKRELFIECVRIGFEQFPPMVIPDPDDPDGTQARVIEASTEFVLQVRRNQMPFRMLMWATLEGARDTEVSRMLYEVSARQVPSFGVLFTEAGSLMVGALLTGLGMTMLSAPVDDIPDSEIERMISSMVRVSRDVALAQRQGSTNTTIEVLP